ncbi:MAG: ferrochelatase [Thermoplasmata archaeon]
MKNKKAAILMAYGSPENISDLDEYLQDIFGKNPVPPEARADNLKKYSLFGNRSPSNYILASLKRKVEEKLSHSDIDVYLSFKHWHPSLKETAEAIANANYSEIVEIPLFPFPSEGVFSSYSIPFSEELKSRHFRGQRHVINGFYQYPGFLEMWSSRINDMLENGKYDRLLLTAHSLPTLRSSEETYSAAFRAFCKNLGDSIPTLKTISGFQSRSKYGNSWLEPSIQKVIAGESGIESVLVAPLGFSYEHLEVLYDLDIDFSLYLKNLGIRYARVKLMNDSDGFVDFISDIVKPQFP